MAQLCTDGVNVYESDPGSWVLENQFMTALITNLSYYLLWHVRNHLDIATWISWCCVGHWCTCTCCCCQKEVTLFQHSKTCSTKWASIRKFWSTVRAWSWMAWFLANVLQFINTWFMTLCLDCDVTRSAMVDSVHHDIKPSAHRKDWQIIESLSNILWKWDLIKGLDMLCFCREHVMDSKTSWTRVWKINLEPTNHGWELA